MPGVKNTMESTSWPSPVTQPSSSSASTKSHDNYNGQSPRLGANPSTDNLKDYMTPGSTWDSQSTQANSLKSPGGSSTHLVSRRLDGNITPLNPGTGSSTPILDPKHPARSLCHTLHERVHPDPPYHVFPKSKKKRMMYVAAIAGMFSSLSANIYFPALGQISREISVSISVLSFTVTVYMIVQALAPSFWGPLSDIKGRRVAFIGTFIVYLTANLGLALSTGFVPLMVFRGLQAAGSAATISIGQGLIADIATPSERGSFTGTNQGIRVFGQAIGPVFGGIISQYLGYHAIFWFLFGGGILALAFLVVFLPETLRPIAGNGTICLKGIHRPLYYRFTPSLEHLIERNLPPKKKFHPSMIFTPFQLLLEKDVFAVILFGAVVYAVWSMVTSSTTALFQSRFNLSDLQVGLVFLPNGVASMLGSYLTGKLSKHDWAVVERRHRREKGIPHTTALRKDDLVDFPFGRTRLRSIWWLLMAFIFSTALYGFSLQLNILALPLILQFAISYTANSIFTLNSTLVVDLYPRASASATAVNNLVRCLFGAGGVALVQVMIDVIGSGPTFAMWSGVTALLTPLLVLQWRNGQRWAMERHQRVTAKESEKKSSDVEKVQTVLRPGEEK